MTTTRKVSRLVPASSGRERLTVDATAGGVSLTVPAGAIGATLRLETAQIRFTLDGSAPTSAVGRLLEVGEVIELESQDEINAFLAIRTGSNSGVLDVEYVKEGTGKEVTT